MPPNPNGFRDVFLSYTSRDKNAAERVNRILKSLSLSVWDYLDPETLTYPGDGLNATLEYRLRHSGMLILILSPNTRHSNYTVREVEFAQKIGLRVIPLVVDEINDDDIFFAITDLIYLDVKNLEDTKLRQLIREQVLPLYKFHSSLVEQDVAFFSDKDTRALIDVAETASAIVENLAVTNISPPFEIEAITSARSCIFAVDDRTNELYIVAATFGGNNYFDDNDLHHRFASGAPLVGEVWQSQRPRPFNPRERLKSLQASDYHVEYPDAVVFKLGFWLGMPIRDTENSTLIGVLVVEHPDNLLANLNGNTLNDLIDEIAQLANVAAGFMQAMTSEDDYRRPMSFYSFISLRHILRVARRLPMFQRDAETRQITRNHEVEVRSAVYHHYKDQDNNDKLYILASSQGFRSTDLTREFYIGQALVGRVLQQGTVLLDDREADKASRREALDQNLRDAAPHLTDEQIEAQINGIIHIMSVLAVPIFNDEGYTPDKVMAVLTLASYQKMAISRLNHPSILADSMRLANLAARIIQTELHVTPPTNNAEQG